MHDFLESQQKIGIELLSLMLHMLPKLEKLNIISKKYITTPSSNNTGLYKILNPVLKHFINRLLCS